jgi:hypothetical protein
MHPHPDRHVAPLASARPTAAASSPALPTMAEILAKYGATWQIEIAEPASFVAIRRPTPTSQELLVAHSVAELDRKLAAESSPGEQTSS